MSRVINKLLHDTRGASAVRVISVVMAVGVAAGLGYGVVVFSTMIGLVLALLGGLAAAVAVHSLMSWVVTTHHTRISWMHGRAMTQAELADARIARCLQFAWFFAFGALAVLLIAHAEVGAGALPLAVLLPDVTMAAVGVLAALRSLSLPKGHVGADLHE